MTKKNNLLFTLTGPFRIIYKIWFLLVFFATGILLYPFLFVFRELRWKRALFFVKSWIWLPLLQFFLGLIIKIKHPKTGKFPKGPFIICANHTSYLDIVFLYAIYRDGPIFFLGKESLKKFPFIGMFFKRGIHVPIKREVKSDASSALKEIGTKLDAGFPIVIFPEGTQSKNPPFMNAFKAGAFKLAIEKQVPIVPMTFINNFKLLSKLEKLTGPSRPGISRIIIHEKIETKGLIVNDLVALQEQTRSKIEESLKEYYPEKYTHENR